MLNSADLAAEVLEGLATEEAFWQSAIRAEASLLLGRVEEATHHYDACVGAGAERTADLQSVWTQARRLCAALHGDPGLVDECFAGQSSEPEPLAEHLQALRQRVEVHLNHSRNGVKTAFAKLYSGGLATRSQVPQPARWRVRYGGRR